MTKPYPKSGNKILGSAERVLVSPEGCKIVAGGRSEAQTSGKGQLGSHPEGVPLCQVQLSPNISHPSRVLFFIDSRPVVAATTGYYLAALRAERT